MKRFSLGLLAVAAVLATGAATSACNVTPDAATVNGATIPVSSLNSQLTALDQTPAGQCLLSLKFPESLSLAAQGSGGAGTYQTGFASTILGSSIYNLLATQYAVAHGIHLTAGLVASAQTAYESILDGAISSQQQQDASIGGTSSCADADGTALTGKQVLAGLPPEMRNIEVTNQAVEQLLLARGADLSDAAVLKYYAANPGDFTLDCVSVIVVADQATADTVYNKLQAGTDFATLAASTSTDTKSAAQGGQLGCNFPETQVLQSLQETSVTVGKPATPEQTQSGQWVVYQVTSRTVEPVTSVASEIKQVLLQTTANRSRVSAEVLAFAKRSSVEVNPQYGSWTKYQVVPPTPPPARYLAPQAASSGSVPTTTTSPLTIGGTGSSASTASGGSSGSTGTATGTASTGSPGTTGTTASTGG